MVRIWLLAGISCLRAEGASGVLLRRNTRRLQPPTFKRSLQPSFLSHGEYIRSDEYEHVYADRYKFYISVYAHVRICIWNGRMYLQTLHVNCMYDVFICICISVYICIYAYTYVLYVCAYVIYVYVYTYGRK